MKNFKYFCLAFCFALLSACGDNKPIPEINVDDYYDFEGFSLKEYGIPAMVMLPGETANIGASTLPEVEHEEGHHRWRIAVGQNFHFEIEDWGNEKDMVAFKKKELAENKNFKIKYLIEDPNFIYFERELVVGGSSKAADNIGVAHKSNFVYAQYIIGGITYVFESRDEGDAKVIAEFISKSLKSVKPN